MLPGLILSVTDRKVNFRFDAFYGGLVAQWNKDQTPQTIPDPADGLRTLTLINNL